MRWVAIPIFSTPIIIAWAVSMANNTENWESYKIFVEIWIPIIVSIPTSIFVLLFAIQIKQEKGVLKTNIKQLEITQQDFDRRGDIIASEMIRDTLKQFSEPKVAQLIRDLKERPTVTYNDIEHDVRYLLNICEGVAIQYYVLKLDINIIDEQLGNIIIIIYDHNKVKKIKTEAQQGTDLYSNIDKFYPKLKELRNKKMNSYQ